MAQTNDDCMTPASLLPTIRELVADAHAELDGSKAAVKAMAVVHLFHIMDILIASGHDVPDAWKPKTDADGERHCASCDGHSCDS